MEIYAQRPEEIVLISPSGFLFLDRPWLDPGKIQHYHVVIVHGIVRQGIRKDQKPFQLFRITG